MKELPIGVRFPFPREDLAPLIKILAHKPAADETATPEEVVRHKAVMEANHAGIYVEMDEAGDIFLGGNEAIEPSQN